jgi:hypothetical protein
MADQKNPITNAPLSQSTNITPSQSSNVSLQGNTNPNSYNTLTQLYAKYPGGIIPPAATVQTQAGVTYNEKGEITSVPIKEGDYINKEGILNQVSKVENGQAIINPVETKQTKYNLNQDIVGVEIGNQSVMLNKVNNNDYINKGTGQIYTAIGSSSSGGLILSPITAESTNVSGYSQNDIALMKQNLSRELAINELTKSTDIGYIVSQGFSPVDPGFLRSASVSIYDIVTGKGNEIQPDLQKISREYATYTVGHANEDFTTSFTRGAIEGGIPLGIIYASVIALPALMTTPGLVGEASKIAGIGLVGYQGGTALVNPTKENIGGLIITGTLLGAGGLTAKASNFLNTEEIVDIGKTGTIYNIAGSTEDTNFIGISSVTKTNLDVNTRLGTWLGREPTTIQVKTVDESNIENFNDVFSLRQGTKTTTLYGMEGVNTKTKTSSIIGQVEGTKDINSLQEPLYSGSYDKYSNAFINKEVSNKGIALQRTELNTPLKYETESRIESSNVGQMKGMVISKGNKPLNYKGTIVGREIITKDIPETLQLPNEVKTIQPSKDFVIQESDNIVQKIKTIPQKTNNPLIKEAKSTAIKSSFESVSAAYDKVYSTKGEEVLSFPVEIQVTNERSKQLPILSNRFEEVNVVENYETTKYVPVIDTYQGTIPVSTTRQDLVTIPVTVQTQETNVVITDTTPPFITPPIDKIPNYSNRPVFPNANIPSGENYKKMKSPVIFGKMKTKYMPSIAAEVFNITATKQPKSLSGIEIRPVIKRSKSRREKW